MRLREHELPYLDHLEHAVGGLLAINEHQTPDLGELGHKISYRWGELECVVTEDKYDVLRGRNWEFCRGQVVILLHLLYQIPGASPVADIEQIREKNREYGGSWIERGGIGAFFSAVRKIDRIKNQLMRFHGHLGKTIENDRRTEGVLDDLGDLRRYLLLWEAWWRAMEQPGVQLVVQKDERD